MVGSDVLDSAWELSIEDSAISEDTDSDMVSCGVESDSVWNLF